MRKPFLLLTALTLLSGCNNFNRLKNLGKEPPLSTINNPAEALGYRNVSMPMPTESFTSFENNSSLWNQGHKSFFKDQRASHVGDILTIAIDINDSASLKNKSTRNRVSKENAALPTLYGIEKLISELKLNPATLANSTSSSNSTGDGGITRNEKIKLNVAGVVSQILPNGNMVITGRQEVRVNYELRQLQVAGIIRPEDINPSTNTVPFEKIAEARVSYGGKGHLSDYQQERYGKQVLDIVLPF